MVGARGGIAGGHPVPSGPALGAGGVARGPRGPAQIQLRGMYQAWSLQGTRGLALCTGVRAPAL